MPIKYKYNREDEVIINDGNRYEYVEGLTEGTTTRWQALGTYYDSEDDRRNIFIVHELSNPEFNLYQSTRFVTNRNEPFFDGITGEYLGQEVVDYEHLKAEDDFLRRYSIDESSYSFFLNRINNREQPPGRAFARRGSTVEKLLYSIRTRRVPRDGSGVDVFFEYPARDVQLLLIHPANGEQTVTLKIYSDDELLFSRTETGYPQYVEVLDGKVCANNTCPVRCDNYVCCYGSDGTATESFLFSESIYR